MLGKDWVEGNKNHLSFSEQGLEAGEEKERKLEKEERNNGLLDARYYHANEFSPSPLQPPR
jgi:hypothetical protein